LEVADCPTVKSGLFLPRAAISRGLERVLRLLHAENATPGVEDDGTLQGEAALCAAYRTNPEKARADLVSHFQALIVENVKPVPSFKISVVEVKQQPVLVIRVEGGKLPYSYTGFWRELKRAAAVAKIGDLATHAFRHTYRTWLDSIGTPVGVQQRLMRHADIRTTMNQYGSALSADMQHAQGKVIQLVFKSA
jgi:hypothetical protein